jgi:hypothetical protein
MHTVGFEPTNQTILRLELSPLDQLGHVCAHRMRDSNTQPFSQKENAPPIELMRLPTTGFEPARVLDPAVLKTAPLNRLGHVGGCGPKPYRDLNPDYWNQNPVS